MGLAKTDKPSAPFGKGGLLAPPPPNFLEIMAECLKYLVEIGHILVEIGQTLVEIGHIHLFAHETARV
jgi:hypothetical protein